MIKLKTAIAGLGFMGGTHLEALRRLGIEVTGVLGISKDEAAAFCERTGVKKYYNSFEDVFKDPRSGCGPYLHSQPPALSLRYAGYAGWQTCAL